MKAEEALTQENPLQAVVVSTQAGFSLALALAFCTIMMYNMCMRKRTNINLEDEDQAAIALIRQQYGVTSDTAAIRFALRKILREEVERNVPHPAREHRQNATTR